MDWGTISQEIWFVRMPAEERHRLLIGEIKGYIARLEAGESYDQLMAENSKLTYRTLKRWKS